MSEPEKVTTSLRGMPKALYERIKLAASRELGGLGISINDMLLVLLREAIEQRERTGGNSGKIDDSIETLELVGAQDS